MSLYRSVRGRRWWSGALIASLLFLQLASSAYACKTGSTGSPPGPMPGMPCAGAMAEHARFALDADQPGLCLEHCKSGAQTIEHTAAAPLAVPALVALFFVAVLEPPSAGGAWQSRRRDREIVRPPPHTILHCCFRI